MKIEITGWTRASRVVEAMVSEGYQVAVYWDGHLHDGKKTYILEYTHPLHDGVMFQLPDLKCNDGTCSIKEEDINSFYELTVDKK